MLDNYEQINLREIKPNAIVYLSKKHTVNFTFMLDAITRYYNDIDPNEVDNHGYIKVSYDYLSYYTGLSIEDVDRFITILVQDRCIHIITGKSGIMHYKPNITAIEDLLIESELEYDKWFGYLMAAYDLFKDGSYETDPTKIKKGDNGLHRDRALDVIFTQKDFKGAYTDRFTKKVYKEEYIEKIKKYYPYIDIIRTRVFWELDKDQSKEYEGELHGWLCSEKRNKSKYELEDEKVISKIHYMLLCNEKGRKKCFNENVYGDDEQFNEMDVMYNKLLF